MTPELLHAAIGARIDRARTYAPLLSEGMQEFDISTPARQAMFLAQIAHESGILRWPVELWGPTEAQRGYEGRTDLGNTQPGDGARFMGRGLIQITGRFNYKVVSAALGVDFITHPEKLAEPEHAARSACWWWQEHGLNAIADQGDIEKSTKRINGIRMNGLAERKVLWASAKRALGVA